MCEVWQIKLHKCREELTSDLSFDLISPQLIQRGIMSTDEYANIRELNCNKTRVTRLIETVLGKDEDVYNKFYSYLNVDYDWLANQLLNTPVNLADKNKYQDMLNQNIKALQDQNSSSKVETRSHSEIAQQNPTKINLAYNNHHDPSKYNQTSNLNPEQTSHSNLSSHSNQSTNSNQTSSTNLDQSSNSNNFSNCSSNPTLNLSSLSSQVLHHTQTTNNPPQPSSGSGSPHHQQHPSLTNLQSPLFGSNLSFSSILSSGSSPRPCGSIVNSSPAGSRANSSPVHSSDLSIFSGPASADEATSTAGSHRVQQVGVKRMMNEDDEISEDIIEFLTNNPIIIRKWQNLAHQVGLSSRVPVIQARIRNDGRDFDEHIAEFIREWSERKPGEATVGGLVGLLRKLRFNDTAGKIEDGSFKKKLRAF